MTPALTPWFTRDADRITAVAYLSQLSDTIDRLEPQIRAFTHLNLDQAMRQAEQSDVRRRNGQLFGPLDGMPFAVKEIIDSEELPTELGSPLFAGRCPNRDAESVSRLRAAGAIVIGITTSTPFACGTTTATSNPHRLEATPGGSSAGSGAAVAAGMVPLALASQSQASTIRPASYCGAYGYKPTHNRLPRSGMHPLSDTLDDLGLIGASLDDLVLAASCLDLSTGTGGQATAWGMSLPASSLRLGWVNLDAGDVPTAQTRQAFAEYLETLRGVGVAVVDPEAGTPLGEFDRAIAGTSRDVFDVFAGESEPNLAAYVDRDPREPDPRIAEMVFHARGMAAGQLDDALAKRNRLRRQLAALGDEFDALITLSTTNPAPDGHASTGCRRMPATWSYLGAPAISLPALTVAGMPQGVQLLGFAGRDEKLFGVSRALERL